MASKQASMYHVAHNHTENNQNKQAREQNKNRKMDWGLQPEKKAYSNKYIQNRNKWGIWD